MELMEWIFQLASAFFSVYFFTTLIEVPKKYAIYAGIAGIVNWWVYLVAKDIFTYSMIAAFFSSLAVAIYSQILARARRTPVTVFLVSGILPTVPGGSIYRCVYYYIHNNSTQGTYYLQQTLLVAGAIAMAIFVTDSVFRMIQHYQSTHKAPNA